MHTPPRLRADGAPRRRAGFTLVEMLVAMTMLLVVMAASMKLLSGQSATVTGQAGRLDALQGARFALTTIERELRMAGAGTVDAQPMLVLASPTAIGFNLNLLSTNPDDQYAVYQNPDADPRAVRVWPRAERLPLPGTSDVYPDTTYAAPGGAPSAAETIVFWLEPDSTSTDPDAHVLYRRVNETEPEIVARGILVGPTDTVFTYYRRDEAGTLLPISPLRQPLLHSTPEHGAPADTGDLGALIDSVRAVRVRIRVAYVDPAGRRTVRTAESRVRLMNAGLLQRTTCGEAPLGTTPSAAAIDVGGIPAARVTWGRSIDEGTGERDVERYAIYRRSPSTPDFGEPLASVPAGQASYEYVDGDVRAGEAWVYGVAALDCTPRSSPVTSTAAVTIPSP